MYTFTAAYRDNIACERISNKAQSIMGIVEDVKEIYIQLFLSFFLFGWTFQYTYSSCDLR